MAVKGVIYDQEETYSRLQQRYRGREVVNGGAVLEGDCIFLNPFLREQFCGLESERGVNSILNTVLHFDQIPEKTQLFA